MGVPQSLQYAVSARRRWRASRLMLWGLVLALSAGVLAWAWHRATVERPVPVPSLSSPVLVLTPTDAEIFYDKCLQPLADKASERDDQAIVHALADLHARFEKHRRGIGTFASDVVSWKTRAGIVANQSKDLWNHHVHGDPTSNNVGAYVQDKFNNDVICQQDLQGDLQATLTAFGEELQASHNRLMVEIELPLRDRHLPVAVDEAAWKQFTHSVDIDAQNMLRGMSQDSVVTGVGGFVANNVGMMAVQQLTAELLEMTASQIGEEMAIAGAGATGGATGTGGGIGTALGGPMGTAVGVGVGFVAGTAIDWWMSDSLKARLTDQSNKFLDALEKTLVDGSDKTPGLASKLHKAVALTDKARRQAIIDNLTKEQP